MMAAWGEGEPGSPTLYLRMWKGPTPKKIQPADLWNGRNGFGKWGESGRAFRQKGRDLRKEKGGVEPKSTTGKLRHHFP